MKIRNGCASLVPVIALSVLGGVAGVASAQEGGAAAPAAPAVVPPEAKALMDRARAAYKDAKTYQDKVSLKFEMRATDPDGNAQNQDESEDMSFTFGGPKKFTMEHKDFRVVSDGATQTAHLKFLNQYVQKPAPEGLIDEAKLGPIGILGALHVPAVLLITPGEHAGKFPLLAEITEVKAEEIKGKAGKRVLGKGEIPDMPFEMMVPMTIWFADDTGLVGEVTMDLKPAYADMMGGDMKIEKAMGTVSFADIRVNEDVAPETFVFTPGSEDKKVDSFGPEQGPDPQLELVGTAAPSFKGSDLEGKPLSLSDYKGKIVVLDFWATWCGPCMQVIPKIQELSAEYADKGVVVLGMNQDEPEALDTVKQTVEKKKLTFRQFMDKEGAVAQQFMVTGIPCTVIIDKEGVIQWIHTGGSPGLKQEISEALEKLLKGESLVKPKEAPAGEPAK